LQTPVPKVFCWSSRAHDNAVGAEYIIMEKAQGVELEEMWPKMTMKERSVLVKNI
jgi:hypothetical protein